MHLLVKIDPVHQLFDSELEAYFWNIGIIKYDLVWLMTSWYKPKVESN
jgi:hypothetical protein